MSFNLLDEAKGFFSNDLVSKVSSFLGESEGGVNKAVSGALPALLLGLINKTNTTEGADAVARLASDQNHSGILSDTDSFFGNSGSDLLSKGAGLLSNLFGNRADGLSGLLSNFSGLKSSSITSLLSMAGPIVLGILGKHAAGSGLNASGLASLLQSQKSSIINTVPSGLNLSSVLGEVAAPKVAVSHVAPHIAHEHEEVSTSSGLRWLMPLLLLALLAAGAYYLFGTGNKHEEGAVATAHEETAAKPETAPVMAARESLKVKLKNGVEIDAYKGGIEDKLVAFLNTDYKALGADSLKNIWFDFDDLNFKTASAEITPESQKQVDNMVAILKAYPEVKLKIGGYTDKVGNEANNKKLSGDRATAVKDALTKAGVGSQIPSAEGYGSSFAKYAADAPEADRVKDRHVSVSVRL